MPNPTAPAPSPAPAAPVSTPSPAPSPAPSTIPTIPAQRPRLSVPAAKALGDTDGPAVLKAAQDKMKANLPPTTNPKPAEPPKPAAPVVPAEPPKPAAPVVPAEPPKPTKLSVKGKEYTEEELAALLAKADAPAEAPAAPAEAPKPEEPPKPTPEQVAKWEAEFVRDTSEVFQVSDAQYDAVLSGGPEGKAALKSILAEALLRTRGSVFTDLNKSLVPEFKRINQQVSTLLENHQQLQRVETEQSFLKEYPDFAPQMDTVRQVAELLYEQYPAQVAKMGKAAFMKEVARQSDEWLAKEYKRWNPNSQGSWKDAFKQAAPPAVPGAPAAPAAPAIPPVQPPAANPPAVTPSAPARNWSHDVNMSLREA